jgi:uncharacterized protein (TIGR03067 family)
MNAFILSVSLALIADAPKDDAVKKDLEALQGSWKAVVLESNGQNAPVEMLKEFKVLFKGDRMIINPGRANRTSTFKLDPSKKPKWMDATPQEGQAKGKSLPAIYELDGDTLKICFDNKHISDKRPTDFKTAPGSGLALFVLKREKK